jgi:hypothetical protein
VTSPAGRGIAFAFALAFLLTGCGRPWFLLPGGELDGERAAAPADWTFAGAFGTAQLETRPEDPYSVNVGFTVVSGQLYVNAGDTETRWVKNLAANPLVRLRVDETLYELKAERVTDPAEVAVFAEAWTSQSVFRRDPRELDRVWLHRLVPR